MERQGLKTVRAVARVTGEDWSRVAKVLKILELPAPVLDYLRSHGSPTVVSYFTESRLHELLKLNGPRAVWIRFQEMIRQLELGASDTPAEG